MAWYATYLQMIREALAQKQKLDADDIHYLTMLRTDIEQFNGMRMNAAHIDMLDRLWEKAVR